MAAPGEPSPRTAVGRRLRFVLNALSATREHWEAAYERGQPPESSSLGGAREAAHRVSPI